MKDRRNQPRVDCRCDREKERTVDGREFGVYISTIRRELENPS